MGLPKALLILAATLFVASVLGSLGALGVFFWYDVAFWYFFEPGPILKVAAVILGGLSVSSGLLFVQLGSGKLLHRRRLRYQRRPRHLLTSRPREGTR
jgi:hypothetical protein